TVSFKWPQDISPWNGVRLSYSNGTVTVGNTSWNGGISAGSSVDFGFGDGSPSLPVPTACTATVNGVTAPCAIVR
ncbi:MAG: cellulose binding domain-containing protein, partial [Actinomycetes bacterium]